MRRKGWMGAALAAVVVLSLFYARFASRQIYRESVSRLEEVYGQVNAALRSTISKNWRLLRSWQPYIAAETDPAALADFLLEEGEALTEGDVRFSIGDKRYQGFSAPFTLGEGRLYFFFPEEELFRDAGAYQYLYLYFGLIVLIACSLFLLGSYAIIHRPIRMLVNAFQRIGCQDYAVRITGRQGSDFMYVYQEFNHMAEELGTLIEKNYQQQLLLSRAELKQLQAQINPHFLYNAFFLLRRMIHDELYEEAGQMADTLGLYFQYITRNSQDYMPLSREYHHAMLYCEIQGLRFGDRIRIETDSLPEQYTLSMIDERLYEKCRTETWCADLVSQFPDYESFRKLGIGAVICKGGAIISGASSYSRYREGIEIEIDTRKDYRRRGLAYICGAKLILECLKQNLYPSWDAHNKGSATLAQKLGYHYSHAYTAVEVRGY